MNVSKFSYQYLLLKYLVLPWKLEQKENWVDRLLSKVWMASGKI